MIVQRILDQAAVRRSNSGSHSHNTSGLSQQPLTDKDNTPPPPYPGAAGAQRKASRPTSPSHNHGGSPSKSLHPSQQNSNELAPQVSQTWPTQE